MIKVTAVLRHRDVDFTFEPEPRFWVLHGTSLHALETSIQLAVVEEMERTEQPLHQAADPLSRVTRCAQRVVDDFIARGLINDL